MGTTAYVMDWFSMNNTAPSIDTAETIGTTANDYAMPVKFDCTVSTGSTACNLRILFQSETVGTTVGIKTGSYYSHSP